MNSNNNNKFVVCSTLALAVFMTALMAGCEKSNKAPTPTTTPTINNNGIHGDVIKPTFADVKPEQLATAENFWAFVEEGRTPEALKDCVGTDKAATKECGEKVRKFYEAAPGAAESLKRLPNAQG